MIVASGPNSAMEEKVSHALGILRKRARLESSLMPSIWTLGVSTAAAIFEGPPTVPEPRFVTVRAREPYASLSGSMR